MFKFRKEKKDKQTLADYVIAKKKAEQEAVKKEEKKHKRNKRLVIFAVILIIITTLLAVLSGVLYLREKDDGSNKIPYASLSSGKVYATVCGNITVSTPEDYISEMLMDGYIQIKSKTLKGEQVSLSYNNEYPWINIYTYRDANGFNENMFDPIYAYKQQVIEKQKDNEYQGLIEYMNSYVQVEKKKMKTLIFSSTGVKTATQYVVTKDFSRIIGPGVKAITDTYYVIPINPEFGTYFIIEAKSKHLDDGCFGWYGLPYSAEMIENLDKMKGKDIDEIKAIALKSMKISNKAEAESIAERLANINANALIAKDYATSALKGIYLGEYPGAKRDKSVQELKDKQEEYQKEWQLEVDTAGK